MVSPNQNVKTSASCSSDASGNYTPTRTATGSIEDVVLPWVGLFNSASAAAPVQVELDSIRYFNGHADHLWQGSFRFLSIGQRVCLWQVFRRTVFYRIYRKV